MNILPDSFSSLQTVTADGLNKTGRQAVEVLAEKGYEVRLGLSPEVADEIKQMSLQPGILEYCPKDSAERFASRQAAQQWLTQKRAVFLLYKKEGSGHLAGYGWSGWKQSEYIPLGKATFSIRVGEADQGLGLATSFSQLVIAASAAYYDMTDIWLEATASNGAAIHIYQKIGFVNVDERAFERQRPSGEVVPDTRVYMLYPNELLS